MKKFILFLIVWAPCLAADYFPERSLARTNDLHEDYAEWYSARLKKMGEVPMFSRELPKNVEQYRFTWLRSFHRPVVLRVEARANEAVMVIKVADGSETDGSESESGKITKNEQRKLSARELFGVRSSFEVNDFFALPSFEEEGGGTDGSRWIVEALVDGRYHVVHRWSPKDGPIFRIGLNLIELAIGGDFTPIY